jgi:hypothetical protein
LSIARGVSRITALRAHRLMLALGSLRPAAPQSRPRVAVVALPAPFPWACPRSERVAAGVAVGGGGGGGGAIAPGVAGGVALGVAGRSGVRAGAAGCSALLPARVVAVRVRIVTVYGVAPTNLNYGAVGRRHDAESTSAWPEGEMGRAQHRIDPLASGAPRAVRAGGRRAGRIPQRVCDPQVRRATWPGGGDRDRGSDGAATTARSLTPDTRKPPGLAWRQRRGARGLESLISDRIDRRSLGPRVRSSRVRATVPRRVRDRPSSRPVGVPKHECVCA